MKKVALIRHKKNYVAYFFDQKSSLLVSSIGAEILDDFLNEDLKIKDIAKKLHKKYHQDYDVILKDAQNFLAEIYDKLQKTTMSEVEQEFLDAPLGVEIEITTACNLRCKHCFQKEYQENYMPFDKYQKMVDLLIEKGVCEINLVGGEVFLHPDAERMIKYNAEKGLVQTIVTNAIAMSPIMINEISQLSRIYIMVSLDGTEELHDDIRGKGQFAKVMKIIKQLKKKHVPVELLCTLNNKNILKIDEIVEFSSEIDIPINFNLFKPFSEKQQDLIVKPEDFFAAVEKLLKLRIEKDYKIGVSDASLVAHLLNLPPRNECTATLAGLVIDIDGRMVTCPYLVEAGYYQKEELPIFDENFIDHWKNHRVFVEFRNNGLRNCQARSFIFSQEVTGDDPYGIEAYQKYKDS